MTKIAKTYRLNQITLQKLNELIEYYSNDLLQHPGQNRKVTAVSMLEYAIETLHAETVLKEQYNEIAEQWENENTLPPNAR